MYIVKKASPRHHQMSIEEFIFGGDECIIYRNNPTNTVTRIFNNIPDELKDKIKITNYITTLSNFCDKYQTLFDVPRKSLYSEFYVPKRSGGYRKIDAPETELMLALRELKQIFEIDFGSLYHTSAFAYVKGRSTIDCVKKHQQNKSRWFAKFDLHNFFGSITQEYTIKMLKEIYPFNLIIEDKTGNEVFRKALSLAFLDGGLPQGTPISPTITNIIMIPIDHELCNELRDYNNQKYIYTRYADDFIISSEYDFDFKDIEKYLIDILNKYQTPFSLNQKKTRYGSSAGSNWNLGVMLNKDNEITVGHKKKKQLQSAIVSYIYDKNNGVNWSIGDVQELQGNISYCKMVEGETIDRIINFINNKYNVNIYDLIKKDLKS